MTPAERKAARRVLMDLARFRADVAGGYHTEADPVGIAVAHGRQEAARALKAAASKLRRWARSIPTHGTRPVDVVDAARDSAYAQGVLDAALELERRARELERGKD